MARDLAQCEREKMPELELKRLVALGTLLSLEIVKLGGESSTRAILHAKHALFARRPSLLKIRLVDRPHDGRGSSWKQKKYHHCTLS